MSPSPKKNPKPKVEPYSKAWELLANEVARGYCPPIYPCKKCNYPVVKGYCCQGCGDNNPSGRGD